jgi:hypothetical protein
MVFQQPADRSKATDSHLLWTVGWNTCVRFTQLDSRASHSAWLLSELLTGPGDHDALAAVYLVNRAIRERDYI